MRRSEFTQKLTGVVVDMMGSQPTTHMEMRAQALEGAKRRGLLMEEVVENEADNHPVISAILMIYRASPAPPTLITFLIAQEAKESAWEYYEEKSKPVIKHSTCPAQ